MKINFDDSYQALLSHYYYKNPQEAEAASGDKSKYYLTLKKSEDGVSLAFSKMTRWNRFFEWITSNLTFRKVALLLQDNEFNEGFKKYFEENKTGKNYQFDLIKEDFQILNNKINHHRYVSTHWKKVHQVGTVSLLPGIVTQKEKESLQLIINDLKKRFVNVEGIWRISGSALKAEELRKFLLEGNSSISEKEQKLNELQSGHELVSLAKKIFKEEIGSFFPNFELSGDLEIDKKMLASAVKQLPENSKEVLQEMLGFFRLVISNKNVNKMNSQNLAITFSPYLFPTNLEKINAQNDLTQLLIDNPSSFGF